MFLIWFMLMGDESWSTLEVKVGDHIIPQVTRFKYLDSII